MSVPTFRVVTPEGQLQGRKTKVFDDKGNDVSHLIRRVVIELDVDKVNSVWMEVNANVDVHAQLAEGVAIASKCQECLRLDTTIDVTSFGDQQRKVRFTTEPEFNSTEES